MSSPLKINLQKKIHCYQHKTVVVPDLPSSQQNKDILIEALHIQDMICNTAKKHYLMQQGDSDLGRI